MRRGTTPTLTLTVDAELAGWACYVALRSGCKTIVVDGDETVAVTVGSAGPTMYVKSGSTWVAVAKAYRKVGGSWQEVALDEAFDASKKYVRG